MRHHAEDAHRVVHGGVPRARFTHSKTSRCWASQDHRRFMASSSSASSSGGSDGRTVKLRRAFIPADPTQPPVTGPRPGRRGTNCSCSLDRQAALFAAPARTGLFPVAVVLAVSQHMGDAAVDVGPHHLVAGAVDDIHHDAGISAARWAASLGSKGALRPAITAVVGTVIDRSSSSESSTAVASRTGGSSGRAGPASSPADPPAADECGPSTVGSARAPSSRTGLAGPTA